jgi:acetyl-CoA C-acetyltransferase
MTLQRACASGLQAIITGSQEIIAGQGKVVIAGGAESMSNAPCELYSLRWGTKVRNDELFDSMYTPILSCPPTGTGMGITAENLCDKFGITREECDEFAFTSHQRAIKATDSGSFKDEILPLKIKDKKGNENVFKVDESIRRDTSVEKLGRLKPIFKEGGKITAGNSCPMNDGASVVVLMNRETAEKLDLQPLARVVSYAVVGVDPDIMGYGPVPATKKALERSRLALSDIELFEVNEAFAPVPIVYMKELGIPSDIVNVNGGAIALGHAIGSSGARISITLMNEMIKRGVRYGVSAICQGTGMGTAVIFENERI